MGPKAYAAKIANEAKELSWMDRMCLKIETYCDLGQDGRGPAVLMQEVEVQLNTFGAGLRKLCNEANDYVQEFLNVPGADVTSEKRVDLPKQRDARVVRGEKQVAKKAAALINFVDEACMKITKVEKKEGCNAVVKHSTTDKEQSVLNAEKSPFGEVAWDWPQQPFTPSTEAQSDQRLLQELGQASRSSVELGVVTMEALENVKDVTAKDDKDVKDPNEMVDGEERAAVTWSSTDDLREIERGATQEASLLDGWEGDDIVINEEDLEPDSWHDWELV